MSEIHPALPDRLVQLIEYLRTQVINHPDKSELAVRLGMKYHRLGYFAKNPGSTLPTADLERMMAYYGIKVIVDLPPVPLPETAWIVHPDNPAYEYEINEDRKPTGKIRKIEIAPKVAAE